MKIVGDALSPYVMRVVIAARAKGLHLPVEEPEGNALSAKFLALNPIGKVPVLVDGAVVLPESDVILSYLEDRYPNPSLLSGSAAERANARLLVRLLDTYSVPSFGPFVQADKAAIAEAVARIDRSLGYIDHFRRDGAFASGDRFSIADCALIPFFFAFEQLQAGFATMDLVNKRPKLAAWWSRAKASEIGAFAMDAMSKALQRFMAAQR